MTAQLIDGKLIAKETRKALRPRIAVLAQAGITPGLTVILVGENPASQVYVRNKERACERLGIRGDVVRLPEETTQEALIAKIEELNSDREVHGILVQLPLPSHIGEKAVLSAIAPEKDVDGFHPINAGKLLVGERGFVPCTPKGVIALLKTTGLPLSGKHAVVVGRSNIVGKPMALLLLRENCTVTIAHSRTQNLPAITKQADILVAAVGKPGFITQDMVKPGAIVIDVGINRLEEQIVGDVCFEEVCQTASFITPVPGGVGAMTIAMLMENTVEAAEQYAAK